VTGSLNEATWRSSAAVVSFSLISVMFCCCRARFSQGVPRYGILPDVVERPQHLPGVLQRVVVVGEDGSRRPRQLADVADRLDAQQQDHGEKNADAQGDSPLYSHGL
jgi:hypothetical protein